MAASAALQPIFEPQEIGLADLLEVITRAAPNMDTELVEKAYHFAAAAHAGKSRKSGEPYICHPVEVAMILAGMQLVRDAGGRAAARCR